MKTRWILIALTVIALAGAGLAQTATEQAPPKKSGPAYVDADGNGSCDYRDSGQPQGRMFRGQSKVDPATGQKIGQGRGNRGNGSGQACRGGNRGGQGGNGSGAGSGQRARRRDGSCQAK